jgi:hypothetical protein
MKSLDELKTIKRNAESQLLNIRGVVGVGIGYKEVGGQKTDEISIRVYVDKKRENVPGNEQIPPEINGTKTDVIEGEATAVPHSMDLKTYNPLRGGIAIGKSVGNGEIEVGTLGAIVRENPTNKIGFLSSYHVLVVGPTHKENDPISQPAGNPANIVAHLSANARLTGNIDAAVAIVDNPSNTLCKIEGIDGSVTGVADVDELFMQKRTHVRKRGITTDVTHGEIIDFAASITMNYGHGIPDGWKLTDQLLIQSDASSPSFSAAGDSGSAIVDDSGKIVGLLVGGPPNNSALTYANNIKNVLGAFDISICTS